MEIIQAANSPAPHSTVLRESILAYDMLDQAYARADQQLNGLYSYTSLQSPAATQNPPPVAGSKSPTLMP
jgi:hypothetical protein